MRAVWDTEELRVFQRQKISSWCKTEGKLRAVRYAKIKGSLRGERR